MTNPLIDLAEAIELGRGLGWRVSIVGPPPPLLAQVCPITQEEWDEAAEMTKRQAANPGLGYLAAVIAGNRKARMRETPRQHLSKQARAIDEMYTFTEAHNERVDRQRQTAAMVRDGGHTDVAALPAASAQPSRERGLVAPPLLPAQGGNRRGNG